MPAERHLIARRAGNPPRMEFITAIRAGKPLGKVIRECDVCGSSFSPYGPEVTCSPECKRERRQKRWREGYYRKTDEEKLAGMKRARERRIENPELAREQDRRCWQKRKADPEKYADILERARSYYNAKSQAIQETRRARRESLDAETCKQLKDRMRIYQREYRRKAMKDPVRAEKIVSREVEYRRQKRIERVGLHFLAIISGVPAPARKCERCEVATVIGKAIFCSACRQAKNGECQRQLRQKQRLCIVCGMPFKSKSSTKSCSGSCRAIRKRKTSHANRTPRSVENRRSDIVVDGRTQATIGGTAHNHG